MTRCVHDETGAQCFNQPVSCGLPLYPDIRRSFKVMPQFCQSESLSLTPVEILPRWIGVPKSINTHARQMDLLVMQQRTCARSDAGRQNFAQRLSIRKEYSCEREGRETPTGNERQTANTCFVQPAYQWLKQRPVQR